MSWLCSLYSISFFPTVPEGLVSNWIGTLSCEYFSPFKKWCIYFFFLAKWRYTRKKNSSFPKTGISHIVVGDIGALIVQLRAQLATLHNIGQGFLASVHFIQWTRAPKSISLLQTLKKNTVSLLLNPFCSTGLNTGALGFTWPLKKGPCRSDLWMHYFTY